MKKLIITLFSILSLLSTLYAQTPKELVEESIVLAKTDYDSAIILAEKAILVGTQVGEMREVYRAHSYLATYNLHKNNFVTSVEHSQKAYEGFKLLEEDFSVNNSRYGMGIAYNLLGMYDDALECFFEVLPYFESSEDSLSQFNAAGLYQNIGSVYYSMDEDSTAQVYLRKGLVVSRKLKNIHAISIACTVMGMSLSNESMDAAMPYFEEARTLSTEIGDMKNVATVEVQIGDYFREHQAYAEAIPYYQKGLEITKTNEISILEAEILNSLGLTYYHLGDLDQALTYVQKGIQVAEREQLIQLLPPGYKNLELIYQAQGHTKKAYTAIQQYIMYADSLSEKSDPREIGQIEGQYQVRLSQMEIDRQSAEIEHFKEKEAQHNVIIRLWFLAAILFVLLIIGISLFHFSRRSKDAKILEKEKLLAKSLQDNLNYRQKEAVDLVSMISFKNEIIKKTEEGFQLALKKSDLDSLKSHIKSISADVKLLSVNQLEMNRLFAVSQDIEHEFHEKLLESYKLTQRDLKLSTLIRLGLSIKEIATIMGSSDKAVEMAKYRLKKKMQLGPEQDLNMFIRTF